MADENTGYADIGPLQSGGSAANRGAVDIGPLQSTAAAPPESTTPERTKTGAGP